MIQPGTPAGDALARYAELVRARFGARVERIVLFGSQARQTARADSDIDVLVVVDTLTHAERVDVVNLAYEAARDPSGPVLTPLVWTHAEHADRVSRERRLAVEIERDGIPL